jgi:hypothetical protein
LGSSNLGRASIGSTVTAVWYAQQITDTGVTILCDCLTSVDGNTAGLMKLTSLIAGQLDVHKVNLKFPIGLDTNKQGRTTSSGNDLVGEVDRLEDESE